jgi:hypothetical protein
MAREQARAATTAEDLKGATLSSLTASGLNPNEAQMRLAGFTEAFGDGRAEAFRTAAGKEFNAAGQLVDTDIPIDALQGQQVLNPALPQGTTLTPTPQTIQPGELMVTPQLGASPTTATPQAVTAEEVVAQTAGPAPQIDAQDVVGGVEEQTVQPTLTSPVETLVPAQLNVSDDALVERRLASLFADIESGEVPPWAKAAHNTAMEVMGARGIGASTIAGGAVALALMQSALPIAAQDAQTFFQADMANFNAEQQAALVNHQTAQQNMLTDVSIANASAQFNASSKMQTQQFVSSMIGQIQAQNASLTATMEQFNTSQVNQIAATNSGNALTAATFNANMKTQVEQFNSTMQNNRDQFNANMAFAVDQSNVTWRRNVNTANTAATNAANQVNVQNRFNLSATALNNLNQQLRDNADRAWQSIEAGMDRSLVLATQANDIALMNEQIDANNWTNTIKFGVKTLGEWAK